MIQPAIFSRFKPDNLLLSTARFSGYNLEKMPGVGSFYRYRLIPHQYSRFNKLKDIYFVILFEDWTTLKKTLLSLTLSGPGGAHISPP